MSEVPLWRVMDRSGANDVVRGRASLDHAPGSGFMVSSLGVWVQGLGFRVQGLGFRV